MAEWITNLIALPLIGSIRFVGALTTVWRQVLL
jgi:hypothetical protein